MSWTKPARWWIGKRFGESFGDQKCWIVDVEDSNARGWGLSIFKTLPRWVLVGNLTRVRLRLCALAAATGGEDESMLGMVSHQGYSNKT